MCVCTTTATLMPKARSPKSSRKASPKRSPKRSRAVKKSPQRAKKVATVCQQEVALHKARLTTLRAQQTIARVRRSMLDADRAKAAAWAAKHASGGERENEIDDPVRPSPKSAPESLIGGITNALRSVAGTGPNSAAARAAKIQDSRERARRAYGSPAIIGEEL